MRLPKDKIRKSPSLLLLLSTLTATVPLVAQDWKTKPFTQWTGEDVAQVLIDSPWVSHCVYRPRLLGMNPFRGKRQFYRVRLLSAAPVRQAYLRYVTLVPDRREMSIDYENLMKEDSLSLLERFINSHPDDIRLTGSDEYIILSITQTWVPFEKNPLGAWPMPLNQWPPRVEDTRPEPCMDLQLSDLADTTYLSTGGNHKVRVVRYEPPSYDNLGAKIYLPRRLPSGKDWVAPGDQQLRFTTRLHGQNISVKFDLKKLTVNGKMEL